MSFILDALKKSEMERQRQTTPGLVESDIVRKRARLPAWAVALGALLAVNLVVLIVVLARGWFTGGPHPQAPTAESAAAQIPAPRRAAPKGAGLASPADHSVTQPHADAPAAPFSPLDPEPQYAPEIPVTTTATTAPDVKPRVAHRRDPVLNEGDDRANDAEVLPTINELNLTGAQALPELHLDVHVYATHPAERFVYVNMRKYHEGAILQEGPTVEHIRRDGVVLNYQGLRFLLPRQ